MRKRAYPISKLSWLPRRLRRLAHEERGHRGQAHPAVELVPVDAAPERAPCADRALDVP